MTFSVSYVILKVQRSDAAVQAFVMAVICLVSGCHTVSVCGSNLRFKNYNILQKHLHRVLRWNKM